MAEPQIFVATPLGKNGMLHIGAASFCASVNAYPNVEWGFTMTHSAEMSRNVLIQKRLEDSPETTHFLFLDSDIAPPKDMLQRMLAHDADIITAPAPLFFDKKVVWNVAIPDTDNWYMLSTELPEEPFYTSKTGGGALLIKREVFEAIGWPWFKTEYMPMNEKNKCLKCGEDIWFCIKAREAGFKILVDPTLVCHHYNQVDLLDIYNAIVSQVEAHILQKSDVGSHSVILSKVVEECDGAVVEIGCGDNSTERLHLLCSKQGKHLTSYENNSEWFSKVSYLADGGHTMVCGDYMSINPNGDRYGTVFIDNSPFSQRLPMIQRFANKAECLVIHDTEDDVYEIEEELNKFKYRYDYTKVTPHTTVVSNVNDLTFIKE